jgi:fumarate hydratase, class II
LLPRVDALASAIETKAEQWDSIVKMDRTHLRDTMPLTVGQEWSGYASQIRDAMKLIEHHSEGSIYWPPAVPLLASG